MFSKSTFKLINGSKQPTFEYLKALINYKRPPELLELLNGFRKDLKEELFDSEEEIYAFIASPEGYDLINQLRAIFSNSSLS